MEAVNALLVAKYPTHTLYIDLCPTNFARPSFLMKPIKNEQKAISCKIIQETDYFTLTCIDTTNDYTTGETMRLLIVQQDVQDLFRSGYILVNDRMVTVKASSGGRDADKAFINLQFDYFEDRMDASASNPDNTPMMKEVYATIKEE